MKRNASQLSPKQRQCALMLARGFTGRRAASAIGVTPATVSEWNKIPAFRLLVEEMLSHAEAEALQALQGLKLKAAETLGSLLDSTPAVAMRAALAILQVESRARSVNASPLSQDAWLEMLAAIETAKDKPDESTSLSQIATGSETTAL